MIRQSETISDIGDGNQAVQSRLLPRKGSLKVPTCTKQVLVLLLCFYLVINELQRFEALTKHLIQI